MRACTRKEVSCSKRLKIENVVLHDESCVGRRNLHNKVMVSTMDKLLEHMIRAELNLVILQNRELAEMQSQSWMHQVGLKKPRVKQLFLHAIPYEAFFLTVTYWRLPRLLPDALKFERHARVQESARLAAALSITDFFRTIDGRRRRKRINTLLANRLKFETWALKEDSHRARRESTTKEEKQGQRGIAKEHGMPVGLLLSQPTHTHNLVLERFVSDHDGLPHELKRHNDLVKELHLHMKVPQPINGIEVLKKMAADNVIVCQAIDPLHAEQFEHEDDLGKKKVRLHVAAVQRALFSWHSPDDFRCANSNSCRLISLLPTWRAFVGRAGMLPTRDMRLTFTR